jgi:hypothetical protein
VLSPSRQFEAVPATTVQQAMRRWFITYGMPQQLQFDHGAPWCSGKSDLPSLFELWLVGLGIEVLWSRVRQPQDNGIVERSHRTLQSWSTPSHCESLEALQKHLDAAIVCQREHYPDAVSGQTRLERFPQFAEILRPYQPDHQPWSLALVYQRLAQGCWKRKVDNSGRISLYNHNYHLGRSLAGLSVWVRFDPHTGDWVCSDAQGNEHRCASLEINATGIQQLKLHRSRAKNPIPQGDTALSTENPISAEGTAKQAEVPISRQGMAVKPI